METFDTKLASLTYLTNPLYQQKIEKQKKDKDNVNKSDIKFYRKRISSLTKDMLKGDIPDNNFIKSVYETYVNGIIKYFKMIDTTDIIQEQYINNDIVDNVDIADEIKEVNMTNVNDIMMNKYPTKNTLDNFVIKQHNDSNETKIIPIILDVNLKEPSLKTKGVREKSKKKKSVDTIPDNIPDNIPVNIPDNVISEKNSI